MPIVNVYWFPERSHEMRQKAADGIAQVLSDVTGAPKDIMRVLFVDVPTTHWSKGGKLVSDYDKPPAYMEEGKK